MSLRREVLSCWSHEPLRRNREWTETS